MGRTALSHRPAGDRTPHANPRETMSLHAQPSPEAVARLHAQKRNSTLSSILISVLTTVLVALLLGVFLLPELGKTTQDFEVIYVKPVEPPIKKPEVARLPRKNPAAPAKAMTPVIVSNIASPTSVPVPEVEVTTPSTDFGDADDFGDSGDSDGIGPGDGFDPIRPELSKRCSKPDRLNRLAETGGNPACEEAVEKGLEWLKASQKPDGSWTNGNVPGMTGLALLAYLGRCETPVSEKYGESCLRAITWLVDLGMKQNGSLATNSASQPGPYEHAIATYALAEAVTFCKQVNVHVPNLMEVTQKAGQMIIDNQHPNGGWAYNYATGTGAHTDLSVVAWQLQALKACQYTGLEFKGLTRAASRGLDYTGKMQNPNGGFGYNSPNTQHAGGYFSLTGAGVLSMQMWGRGSQAAARKGARYIEKESKFDYKTEFADLYGHYYEAQAMLNRGGQQWRKYNDMFRDQLLKNQASDGSWEQPGANGKVRGAGTLFIHNVHYRTTLAILMLEVYYRFLPGTGSVK
jgi:hypothetical protein